MRQRLAALPDLVQLDLSEMARTQAKMSLTEHNELFPG